MPTTRRPAGAARGRTALAKGQSTISFTNKVTKPLPREAKNLISPAETTSIQVPERTKPVEKEVEQDAQTEDENRDEEEQEGLEEEVEEEEEEEETVSAKSEAEIRAEKLTDAHIDKHWRGIERARKAPRVHQEGLSVNEKVLRYFDVSSQYGPCIGMDRTRRWERAERLGLNPPIEVLAVLLKEHEKNGGGDGVEAAQMDHILNSIAVGS